MKTIKLNSNFTKPPMKIEEIATKSALAEMEERLIECINSIKQQGSTGSTAGLTKEWITTAEFQRCFGIKSANTIQTLIHKHRELKPAKLGGRNLFHLPTIHKFLKKEL